MINTFHYDRRRLHHGSSQESTQLSMMAVQELLGLFAEHQNHAHHLLAVSNKPFIDLQAVVSEKPLSFI